ncbi:MAG TPA: hypothetical protein VK762_07060 [Polyangiaceae bacterium]|nr:hypothetical protein [Polyangiaceae bacterium]
MTIDEWRPFLLICASCSLTGLGNYPIQTCSVPIGARSTIQGVGNLGLNADLTFTSASGAGVVAAYAANVLGGTCVQGVSTGGYLAANCAFFGGMLGLAPRQPWAVPMGAGRAVAAVATTAPCTQGQLRFEYDAPGIALDGQQPSCDAAGASLPSLAPLGDTVAIMAWYQTSVASRSDPLQSCANAQSAPLLAAVLSGATSAPTLSTPIPLTTESTSVRPPATLAMGSQIIVAAPNGDDVGVWALDATHLTASPASIPQLAGARAVSIATDGTGDLAVVAEIGCTPQSIALVLGTLQGGFSDAVIVAPQGNQGALQPTVAWAPAEGSWVVSWISTDGGAHVLAMRFDATGNPRGAVIDPGVSATGASASADGSLLAYAPSSQSFVSASLGCAE